MKQIALVTLLLLVGCSEPYIPQTRVVYENHCSEVERPILIEFVQTCIAKGNNMSDEEMEDVIEQCEITGTNIVCPKMKTTYVQTCQNCTWILTEQTYPNPKEPNEPNEPEQQPQHKPEDQPKVGEDQQH